jgi:hypothetical protein
MTGRRERMDDLVGHEPIDLDGIADRLRRATPGPWYCDAYDDNAAASMIVVTTEQPDPDRRFYLRWPNFPTEAVVAATLVQTPGSAFCHASERYDEDGEFIAHARTDVEVLLAEVTRLRAIIDSGSPPLQ